MAYHHTRLYRALQCCFSDILWFQCLCHNSFLEQHNRFLLHFNFPGIVWDPSLHFSFPGGSFSGTCFLITEHQTTFDVPVPILEAACLQFATLYVLTSLTQRKFRPPSSSFNGETILWQCLSIRRCQRIIHFISVFRCWVGTEKNSERTVGHRHVKFPELFWAMKKRWDKCTPSQGEHFESD